LIITDFKMPVMDGATLLRELAMKSENSTTPVIVMSSLPEATVKERCPLYAALLRKPFNNIAVVDRVNEIPGKTGIR
jgi:CheY-like chemotaxis protein